MQSEFGRRSILIHWRESQVFQHQNARRIGTYRLVLAHCLLTNLPFFV